MRRGDQNFHKFIVLLFNDIYEFVEVLPFPKGKRIFLVANILCFNGMAKATKKMQTSEETLS